jgi:hypothetical protein
MYISNNIKLLEFYTSSKQYTKSFNLFELVNDLAIINQSTNCNVYVDGVLLVPGQQFSAGGNYGEVNNQNYNVTIQDLGGGVPSVLVLLKTYKNISNV